MRNRFLLILATLCGISAQAQTLADTTKITVFDRTNQWIATGAELKAYCASGGGGSVATDAIWDAKGDFAIGTGANTAAILAVGADGSQLYSDASTSSGVRWGPSVITPSTITSDQNNYSPTGWANCQDALLSADNGIRAITSFSATFAGDKKNILNVGSYPIYFPSEYPSATAANRIVTPGSDFILYPGCGIVLSYDGTRWRLIGQEKPGISTKSLNYFFSAGSVTAADYGDIGVSNLLTGANQSFAPTTTFPAAWELNTSSTTNGGSTIYFSKTALGFSAYGSAHIGFSSVLSLPTLSDATNTYTCSSQLSFSVLSTTVSNISSVGIRYTHGVNSGKWLGYSQDNSGVETTVDLGITVSAGEIYLLTTEINKARTEARFYINGVFAGRVTGNMPSATNCGARVVMLKSAGTIQRACYVHSMYARAVYP